jgi:hypothetical protein
MAGSTELDGKLALFTEEQRLLHSWRWGMLILAMAVIAFVLWLGLGPARPQAGSWVNLPGILGVTVGILVPFLMFTMNLSVRVTDTHIHIHYRPLRKRTIAFVDVTSCEARRYQPILEYGGWGLRLGNKGWAYTVSGREGVQLSLRKGQGLLIGSQKATELAAVIRRGMKLT